MLEVGDTVEIGKGCQWGGQFKILEIVKRFKNGKIAVRVYVPAFYKTKVFHINPH